MKKKLFQIVLPAVVIIFLLSITGSSQSISATYTNGDIPTFLGMYSSTCNGPLTKLAVPLPSGGPWTVTGIDIAYAMTAQANGKMVDQRSYIRCQNTSTSEGTVYQGNGGAGTYLYSRTNVNIANGSYPGGAILNFEMRAWRLALGTGCNTTYNKVDNATWNITVHYSQVPNEGSVGIGTTDPATSAILDLHSTTKGLLLPRLSKMQRDAIASPEPGLLIYNTTSQKMEVFSNGWTSIMDTSIPVKRLFGGSSVDATTSGQQIDNGGYILAGYSSSSNSGTLTGIINYGSYDGWVFKLDQNANVTWQKLYGGSLPDSILDIHQSADGGYIGVGLSYSSDGTLAGLTQHGASDLWVFKLDASGGIVWQKLYGGTSLESGHAIVQTSDGGYSISCNARSTDGTLAGLINNGGTDVWIVKLSSMGEIEWQHLYGGDSNDIAHDIRQTSDGGYIVASTSSSTSNSGTLIACDAHGGQDYWIMKLNSQGVVEWQSLLGGNLDDDCKAVRETSDGSFIISGTSYSSANGTLGNLINNGLSDVWLLKIDDSGVIQWQRLFGDIGEDINEALGPDLIADDFVTIGCNAVPNGTIDFSAMALDIQGALKWQTVLGGSFDDISADIQKTNDDGFLLIGRTKSSNTGTLLGLLNNGNYDGWIVKVDRNGNTY